MPKLSDGHHAEASVNFALTSVSGNTANGDVTSDSSQGGFSGPVTATLATQFGGQTIQLNVGGNGLGLYCAPANRQSVWWLSRSSDRSDLPKCPSCAKLLDHIDHVGTQHTILDNGVYREWAWKMAIKRIVVVILSSVISPMTPPRSA